VGQINFFTENDTIRAEAGFFFREIHESCLHFLYMMTVISMTVFVISIVLQFPVMFFLQILLGKPLMLL
jgi:hypothetical protein